MRLADNTPLGAIDEWPQTLKTAVRTLLTSRFAMWMSWGPELTFLYNGDYARMTLGEEASLGTGETVSRSEESRVERRGETANRARAPRWRRTTSRCARHGGLQSG